MFNSPTSIFKFFTELFVSGFLLGLGPCLTSCGIMLPYIAGTKRGWKEGFRAGFLFSCGRLVVYVFLGGIAGISGTFLHVFLEGSDVRHHIHIYGGIFILVLGLTILFSGMKQSKLCAFLHRWDHINIFLAGVIIALVPCIPLIGILSYLTLHAHSYVIGAIAGAVFGLGTIFSLFPIASGLLGVSASFVTNQRVYAFLQKLCGCVVVYFALQTIIRAIIMLRI